MPAPKASRPHIPGYGIAAAGEGNGLLPWSWALERLVGCRNYFVAVTRPDGAPHVTPVWGIWRDDVFWFSTGGGVKIRSLAAEPRCVITTDHADEAVVVEGTATTDFDAADHRAVVDEYNQKYSWNMEADPASWYVVRPQVVFGFFEPEFTTTATRWTFG